MLISAKHFCLLCEQSNYGIWLYLICFCIFFCGCGEKKDEKKVGSNLTLLETLDFFLTPLYRSIKCYFFAACCFIKPRLSPLSKSLTESVSSFLSK